MSGTLRNSAYRGRLAPSPTGYLHLGHARTFWRAHERAKSAGGTLILRNEDLDRARCKPEFVAAMLEDLRWFGCEWSEGPDLGGPFGPYNQSERMPLYIVAFERLRSAGVIYPCGCSRQDVLRALSAPHHGEEEPVYPGTCRKADSTSIPRAGVSWRFRVPDGTPIGFNDGYYGPQQAMAGVDFGDFLVWRKDDFPSYQLAVVLDDALMGITEVVRGQDLITSTFRQLLLYWTMGFQPPQFYHCPLLTDPAGKRLAKRDNALALKTFRDQGMCPQSLRKS